VVIFKLRSPLTAILAFVLVLVVAGPALFRVSATWKGEVEVVLSGDWGRSPGQFGRGIGIDGRPRGPQALAADAAGSIVVADSLNGRIQIFSPGGELLEVFAVPGDKETSVRGSPVTSYGLLQPCLAWGSGFRPAPDLAGPAAVSDRPVAAGEVAAGGLLRPIYITDIGLSEGAWRLDEGLGRVDPASGPAIYLLAGWDGLVLATDATGDLIWKRDMAAESAEPRPEAGYLLDLVTLPGETLLVSGYTLMTGRLVYFVRQVTGPEGVAADLASYTITRDGTVKIDETLPVQLEVESVCVGADGRLYVVAAAPSPGSGVGDSERPFRRDVWIFSRQGSPKGKLTLECKTYTRYLRLVGVDDQGLSYALLGGPTGTLAVFDGDGALVMSWSLRDGAETADGYLARDGCFYVSEATDEGFRVLRYTVSGRRRVVPRWSGG
jgi:hypothetical protein